MTDRAVAEADLMTLLPGLELRFSPSPDKCWWRALRMTRSLVALGPRGSYRGVITSRLAAARPGDNVVMVVVTVGVSPGLGDLSVTIESCGNYCYFSLRRHLEIKIAMFRTVCS